MFQKAKSLEELNKMKATKDAKIVRNKKQLSAREMAEKRTKVVANFSSRARDIVTSSIPLP